MEDRICNDVWLLKMKYMLYVNVKSFPYYENKCIKPFFKTNVNIDVGKMAMETFIDLLTSTDSNV